jgi:cytochrome c peroxidase
MPIFGHKRSATIAGTERHPMAMQNIIAAVVVLVLGSLLSAGSPTPATAQGDISRMKAEYRRPPVPNIENRALVDLGRELFFDPRISASGKTACARVSFR